MPSQQDAAAARQRLRDAIEAERQAQSNLLAAVRHRQAVQADIQREFAHG